MNRNIEAHFSQIPNIDIQRSMFDRSFSHKTSADFGQLIPIFCDEVLPGDTFQVETNVVARMQTLLNPIMDNAYLDTYFFFVPNRLVWDHWKDFCGENNQSAWVPTTTYSIPQVKVGAGSGFPVGSIADHFGIPTGVGNFSVNALPFRGYALIVDEFFRDQNIQQPILHPTDDADVYGTTSEGFQFYYRGGMPFRCAKFHDYYSSCLPAPLKSDPVGAPISIPALPVIAGDVHTTAWRYNDLMLNPRGSSNYFWAASSDYAASGSSNMLIENDAGSMPRLTPVNLWTIPSGANVNTDYAGSININTLRLAFQLQRFWERCARGGTRYSEFIKAQFNTDVPDARVQRPEYLGGHRISLSIHEVVNNSQNEAEQSFLGNLGAMSVTADQHEDFIKSFTEHGYIIGLAVARYDHSYSQGLDRMWTRTDLMDFYLPVFSNIGEKPVYDYELYLDAQTFADKSIFGYQEAWAEYRYKNNMVTGEMRPGVQNSLASWHFGDYYTSKPSLNPDWIHEDVINVDRALAVSHNVSNQYFADFYFKLTCTRPMPMYSIPGLIDHN